MVYIIKDLTLYFVEEYQEDTDTRLPEGRAIFAVIPNTHFAVMHIGVEYKMLQNIVVTGFSLHVLYFSGHG